MMHQFAECDWGVSARQLESTDGQAFADLLRSLAGTLRSGVERHRHQNLDSDSGEDCPGAAGREAGADDSKEGGEHVDTTDREEHLPLLSSKGSLDLRGNGLGPDAIGALSVHPKP